ncbi:MAG: cytochrome C [Acidobacteria bacterium]|nr:MAG: cytochrome C [Acidobacteriota bacterium]
MVRTSTPPPAALRSPAEAEPGAPHWQPGGQSMAIRKMLLAASIGCGIALAGLVVHTASAQSDRPNPSVQLPDYRNWTHLKSMVIFDESHHLYNAFGGMHHVYANDKALPASKTGGPYPDGSALVFVLYDIENAGGAYQATEKKLTALMLKDSKRFASTGGWAFQAWNRDGQALVTDGGRSCYACHRNGAGDSDLVFSRFVP